MDPLLAALTAAIGGLLMLLSGVLKKQLAWRPRRPRRRQRSHPLHRSSR
jgi:hypothetical protein